MPVTLSRALSNLTISTIVLGLFACGGTNKKEYPEIELIDPSIRVATQWVTTLGALSEFQNQQLPSVVFDNTLYVANSDGDVGQVNMDNGKVHWISRLNEKLTAGPAVSKDSLIVANNNAEVILLDKKSGQIKWRSKVASIVLSTPLIEKNKVIVQTITGKVIALNLNTGAQIWLESRVVPALTIRGTSSLVAINDKIITGFANGKITAFNTSTGKTVWETTLATASGRSDLERVVDIDGVFYVNSDILFATAYQGRVAAISHDTGEIIWMRDMSSHTGVVSDGSNLFISDVAGNVQALDAKTGATLWRQTKLTGRDLSTPAVMNKFIIVGDGSGLLHWLSKEDGKLTAQQDLNQVYQDEIVLIDEEQLDYRDAGVTTHPVVVNGKVFVRDNAGGLSVFSVSPQS